MYLIVYKLYVCLYFLVKGWIRKGKILQGMKQSSKALTAYQKALEIDSSNTVSLVFPSGCLSESKHYIIVFN